MLRVSIRDVEKLASRFSDVIQASWNGMHQHIKFVKSRGTEVSFRCHAISYVQFVPPYRKKDALCHNPTACLSIKNWGLHVTVSAEACRRTQNPHVVPTFGVV